VNVLFVLAMALLLADGAASADTARFACPEGTRREGGAPPERFRIWCEKPGPAGEPILHGPWRQWYADSEQLHSEGAYTEGRRSGLWRWWLATGRLFHRVEFEAGAPVGWCARGTRFEESELPGGALLHRCSEERRYRHQPLDRDLDRQVLLERRLVVDPGERSRRRKARGRPEGPLSVTLPAPSSRSSAYRARFENGRLHETSWWDGRRVSDGVSLWPPAGGTHKLGPWRYWSPEGAPLRTEHYADGWGRAGYHGTLLVGIDHLRDGVIEPSLLSRLFRADDVPGSVRVPCPPESRLRAGSAYWLQCMQQDPDGHWISHGPYLHWSVGGAVERGQYSHGKREGTWGSTGTRTAASA